jgi:hypothetical protein
MLQRFSTDNSKNSEVPPIVHEVLRSPSQPLDPETRAFFEPRFTQDFSQVRVHTDAKAAESARAVNAWAFTLGRDLVFGRGKYAPMTSEGRRLLAHELVHVAQQENMGFSPTRIATPEEVSERQAELVSREILQGDAGKSHTFHPSLALMREEVKGGGATPGKGEGVDLIFIIRAPDDQFTNDVTEYVKTVLKGQTFIEVDNLDDIFDHLSRLKARISIFDVTEPAIKVRRIRIVAHGSTTGDVKMTPKGEKNRRWVHPEEVQAYAQNALVKSTLAQVMDSNAEIEFWGCNIGAVPKTGEAWSEAFQATFTATSETFKTGFDEYLRPAEHDEIGEAVLGHRGSWVRVTNTAEIDARGKGLQRSFNAWLMARYAELVNNGDILPIKEKAKRLSYMRELFDRTAGKMRHIVVMKKDDQKLVRPGEQKKWLKLWKTTTVPK